VPELPEVETVRRGLVDHVVGRRIAAAHFTGTRVARRHEAGPLDLAGRLTDRVVQAAERRGKYLWLVLGEPGAGPTARDAEPDAGPGTGVDAGGRLHEVAEPGEALIVHLGMSGQLLVSPAGSEPQRHLHARFDFDDDGPQLRFVDQRTFGGMALAELVPDLRSTRTPKTFGVPLPVAHIAPDPLEEGFDQAALVATLKRRDSAIKRALLDQSLVSGVGNIYADEALWRAGVHGLRPGSALTRPALSRLIDHARDVMVEALAVGGTSFDALYVNVNGASGYFDRSLHAYGQEGRPCARCGAPIRREAFMNRSSYSCPRCQPPPRS